MVENAPRKALMERLGFGRKQEVRVSGTESFTIPVSHRIASASLNHANDDIPGATPPGRGLFDFQKRTDGPQERRWLRRNFLGGAGLMAAGVTLFGVGMSLTSPVWAPIVATIGVGGALWGLWKMARTGTTPGTIDE
jgi:hypothetical protein